MRPAVFLIIFLLYLPVSCFCQRQNHPSKKREEVHLFKPESALMERKFSCIPVETEATLENGHDNWNVYLVKNINFSVPCMNGAAPGTYTVSVNFLISKEGRVTYIKPLTNHGYGMEEEVIKLLDNSPQWIPATRNGRKISSLRSQLVTFTVAEPI
jgi:hypothetical protein